jgi:hypothetical protein
MDLDHAVAGNSEHSRRDLSVPVFFPFTDRDTHSYFLVLLASFRIDEMVKKLGHGYLLATRNPKL